MKSLPLSQQFQQRALAQQAQPSDLTSIQMVIVQQHILSMVLQPIMAVCQPCLVWVQVRVNKPLAKILLDLHVALHTIIAFLHGTVMEALMVQTCRLQQVVARITR